MGTDDSILLKAGAARPRRRARSAVRGLVAAAVVLAGLAGPAAAHADQTGISYDDLRTGWDPNEPGLAPSQVASADFGLRFSTPVSGQVYAQPLVIGTTVVVATENNNVYGIDSDTGAVKWVKNVGPSWPASAIACTDLTPNIGITATPVYDPTTGTVYSIAKVNGSSSAHPTLKLDARSVATGAERSGWPVTIQGKADNSGNVFDPFHADQRTGLLLMNGVVYAGFASHCDHGPYVGWIAGVNTGTRAVHLWTTEARSSSGQAGVWQGGGGLVSDGPGRILFSTGNGDTTPVGPGMPTPPQKADAVVRVKVNPDGSMNSQDLFAPADADQLDAHDRDLGSGGPVALPDAEFGTAALPHLMVQIGKSHPEDNLSYLYLLNRDNLGGRAQGPGGTDKVVGTVKLVGGGVWGHPAVWGGDGGYIYLDESAGHLYALKYSTATGKPAFSLAAQSSSTLPGYSGSPIVTSTGTASGSALVWVIVRGGTNAGELRAYDPLTLKQVWTSATGGTKFTAAKWATPATDSGRIYIGTYDGKLLAFGRPAALIARPNPLAFGSVAVGGGSTLTEKFTNTSSSVETVTAATPPVVPFAATMPAPGTTIAPGAAVNVPVTYTPTASQADNGTMSLTVTDGITTNTASAALTGRGRQSVPAVNTTDWKLNGSATLSGSSLQLTPALRSKAGSAFYKTAVPTAALHAAFTAQIGGGTGADGMTFSILDAAKQTPSALGSGGGGLGYSGLSGVAVTLDTYKVGNNPSSNFVAVATSGSGAFLNYAATSTAIGPLRTGTHTVDVAEVNGQLAVKIDGVQVMSPTVKLPASALVGFTGATGGLTDIHISRSATITY